MTPSSLSRPPRQFSLIYRDDPPPCISANKMIILHHDRNVIVLCYSSFVIVQRVLPIISLYENVKRAYTLIHCNITHSVKDNAEFTIHPCLGKGS